MPEPETPTPASPAAPAAVVPVRRAPRKPRAAAKPALPAPPDHPGPYTLALDIGGTGLKASVLDTKGNLTVDRVRTPTTYPCSPEVLLAALVQLAKPLPPYERVAAGFPGMVRGGKVLSAPHFSTASGPGSKTVPELVAAWSGFDLAAALSLAFGKPARAANDADLQGGSVIQGAGLEVVITLGTGLGFAVYYQGKLMPHMELSRHPFRKGEIYDDQLGDAARRKIGNKKWSKRVVAAVANVDALLFFDHLYIGGGNAGHLKADLGPKVSMVDNIAGLEGGIKLWES